MDQKYIIALEHSGSQIKGVLASVSTNGSVNLTIPTIEAIACVDNTDSVQYGRVQNVINAAKCTNEVLTELERAAQERGCTINGAYVALAGRSLMSESASVETTLPPDMAVTTETLHSLFVEASKMATPNRQVLKVLPRKYWGDSQQMNNPVGNVCRRLRGEFTIVSCNPMNQRTLDLMIDDKSRVNLNVKEYRVTPLAQADMLLDEEAKQLGCVLLDIGYQTITMSIYKDRALQYVVTLPMGSQHITRDIAIGMNWTNERAEKFKITEGDACHSQTDNSNEMARANTYVAARAYEIVANVNANLDYAKFKAADLPGGFILTGRGSRLNNFDQLLASQTKMRVRRTELPQYINFNTDVRNINTDDFISIISIVNQVAHKKDFESCLSPLAEPESSSVEITTVELEPEKYVTTHQEPKAPVTPQPQAKTTTQHTQPQPQPRTVVRDDEMWDKDDPEIADIKKNDKKATAETDVKTTDSPGFLSKLRKKFAKLVEEPDMDEDTVL